MLPNTYQILVQFFRILNPIVFIHVDAENIITEISSMQSVILSSQIREILRDVNAHEISEGTYKPMYHPNKPF